MEDAEIVMEHEVVGKPAEPRDLEEALGRRVLNSNERASMRMNGW